MIQGIVPEKLLDAALFLQLTTDAGYATPSTYLSQSEFLSLMSKMVRFINEITHICKHNLDGTFFQMDGVFDEEIN